MVQDDKADDVPVGTAALSWPGRDGGQQASARELLLQALLQAGLALGQLAQHVARLLHGLWEGDEREGRS